MLKFILSLGIVAMMMGLFSSSVGAKQGWRSYHRLDEVYKSMERGFYSEEDYEKLKKGSVEDYFIQMDKGITLPENQDQLHKKIETYIPGISKEEAVKRVVRGRNNWIVWSGGNDRFWDIFNRSTFGGIDFLKTLSNHPNASTVRSKRWEKLGLVNEPCYKESNGPREDRYGLWLDLRDENCGVDPFEDPGKYPGVKIGSRGKILRVNINGQERDVVHKVGSYYGKGTGIVGLRLFSNPDFDQKAASQWDSKRYYDDPDYYNDPDLIKPYRVGMTCAFCHVGPSPTNPPHDFNNPKWSNLNSNVGAQYYWVDRIFFWNYRKDRNNFIHQLLKTSRPGTLDTSLISSDQINNPRSMNAVYDLPARLDVVAKFHQFEHLRGGQRNNMQFSMLDYNLVPKESVLRNFFIPGKKTGGWSWISGEETIDTVISPRVLKDGSDSVGALGALNRVYVNIGLFSEEWLRHFVPVLGTLGVPGFTITPFRIDDAQKYSGNWNATADQTPDLALFFLASSTPDKLKDSPNGKRQVHEYNGELVNKGKKIFARNCAACHSSKQPEKSYSFFESENCVGEGYLSCWNNYWNYTTSNLDYLNKMEKIVMEPDFLENNYLSTDLRIPVDLLGVQVCSSIATNAIKGNIWDDFSSSSYKSLPNIRQVQVHVPNETGEAFEGRYVSLPGGGRGYIRPPSLISIWSTAPFFNNNTLGPFRYEGTVKARMDSFYTSMDWLLNPEKRGKSHWDGKGEKIVSYAINGKEAKGIVDVFEGKTFINIPKAYFPPFLYNLIPKSFKQESLKGTEFLNSYRGVASIKRERRKKEKSVISQFLSWTGGIFKSKANRKISSEENSYSEGSYGSTYEDSADYLNNPDQLGERLVIGPLPKGIPVNLIANMNLEASKIDLLAAVTSLVKAIGASKKINDEKESAKVFMEIAGEALLKVSKCGDFIVNKGHYFGTKYIKNGKGLSKKEQEALIEFIKHM